MRAVQKRNKSLEQEYKDLSTNISELNLQLQDKEKVIYQTDQLICVCFCIFIVDIFYNVTCCIAGNGAGQRGCAEGEGSHR